MLHPLGKSVAKFAVYLERGRGRVEVFEDGVEIELGKLIQLRSNYVVSVEKGAKLPLNKVQTTLWYYDMFGNKESVSFSLNEIDFKSLKSVLGK